MSPIAMSSETNVSATLSGETETRFSVVGKGLALLEASALCQHQPTISTQINERTKVEQELKNNKERGGPN